VLFKNLDPAFSDKYVALDEAAAHMFQINFRIYVCAFLGKKSRHKIVFNIGVNE
jgi:hypothetical protein